MTTAPCKLQRFADAGTEETTAPADRGYWDDFTGNNRSRRGGRGQIRWVKSQTISVTGR